MQMYMVTHLGDYLSAKGLCFFASMFAAQTDRGNGVNIRRVLAYDKNCANTMLDIVRGWNCLPYEEEMLNSYLDCTAFGWCHTFHKNRKGFELYAPATSI